jgi:hypothetical protein
VKPVARRVTVPASVRVTVVVAATEVDVGEAVEVTVEAVFGGPKSVRSPAAHAPSSSAAATAATGPARTSAP